MNKMRYNSMSKNYIMKLNKKKKNKERMYAQYTNGNKIKHFFFSIILYFSRILYYTENSLIQIDAITLLIKF